MGSNNKILSRKEVRTDSIIENKFLSEINNFINKVESATTNFRFNVCIAAFYELYNLFKINLDKNLYNKVLKEITKYMKLMLPFTPHISVNA